MIEQPTTERIDATDDEPLPNGGAYAIVYYQDSDGTPVPKESALRVEAIEYRADGKELSITLIDLTLGNDE